MLGHRSIFFTLLIFIADNNLIMLDVLCEFHCLEIFLIWLVLLGHQILVGQEFYSRY